MNTKSLLLKLSKLFPKKYAKQNHDFVGLMVGKLPLEVNKILICLDLDEEIIEKAISESPDLIITHHPFIYGKKSKVLKYDLNKKVLYDRLEKENIPVYSMHTNFDAGKGGMNDALANKLCLKNIRVSNLSNMMRIGELPNEMEIKEFSRYAKEKLGVSYSLLINEGTNLIKQVAIIGGGGSSYWKIAKEEGADIYISGDAPHHNRRAIVTNKFNYLDMPHEIEKIFMPTLEAIIKSFDENIKVITIDHERLPEVI